MAECIERKALLEALENADPDVYEDYGDGTVDWGFGRKNIQDIINSIPAADVAPVVRCKDCLHLYGTLCTVCGLLPRKPDDFCSLGERKDGADHDT